MLGHLQSGIGAECIEWEEKSANGIKINRMAVREIQITRHTRKRKTNESVCVLTLQGGSWCALSRRLADYENVQPARRTGVCMLTIQSVPWAPTRKQSNGID